ncbi:MAG: methionine--tRNA ligase [Elusimicrobiota bacterium]|jgi:methionyl-tRNA synthetase|nr:methionine--tRNA ligase [Elusimicrobiota bacterium]
MNKFYITTPIYYINDVPHIGHCYTTIAADIVCRYKRLCGFEARFVTGTDEHGAKMEAAAKAHGESAQEFVDKMSQTFSQAWRILNISYTDFVRTTDPRHIASVNEIVNILYKKDLIYKSKYEGLYCVGCEKYLSEKDLDENGNCPYHKTKPVVQSEENYFFRLSNFTQEILNKILNGEIKIEPEERKNEIVGKIKLGLDDISVSRAALEWGIPLPFDKSQTLYVWIDALISYLTGIGYSDDKELFNAFWPCDIHLMAKDILWFHAVIWPALLMGADLKLPKTIYSHGFFTIEQNKMSKSLGNVISPDDLVNKFGVDATRYLTVTLIPFGPDGDISWQGLISKYNSDLANNLGNLEARVLRLAEQNFDSVLAQTEQDLSLAQKTADLLNASFFGEMESLHLHKAAESLQKAITLINQQIEKDAPWNLAKTDKAALAKCLWSYLQAADIIAICLIAFMPETSQKIWSLNGANGSINEAAQKYFKDKKIVAQEFSPAGAQLSKSQILFPRIKA